MPQLDDHRWMTRAIELAHRCPPATGAYSVGAVIVDENNEEIAFGFSVRSTTRCTLRNPPS